MRFPSAGDEPFDPWHAAFRCAVTLVLFTGLIFGMANCANSNLVCVAGNCQDQNALPQNKVEMKGNFCTADPASVALLYRILFIVDVSGSTSTSDPGNQRGPAVQAAIAQYAGNPDVTFALMSFDTQPNLVEPNFTNDTTVLYPDIPQLNVNGGSTNYGDTLTAAQNLIAQDANSLPQGQRALTVYNIQWLSDGVPSPTCVPAAQAATSVQSIVGLVKTYGLLGITFSTTFLTGAASNTPCDGNPDDTPTGIMTAMANAGGGTFQALDGNSLKFNIVLSSLLEPFTKQFFYLVNESRVVKDNKLYPDSDMDGVSDDDEIAQGYDPKSADPNKTGCTDTVNAYIRAQGNTDAECIQFCKNALTGAGGDPTKMADSDADGINDCSETALKSGALKADTDGDNLVDALELRFGTDLGNPTTLTIDSDNDGVKDADEIIQGTNPFSPEGDRSLAYVYGSLTATNPNTSGTSCYNFDITNVQLVQTIATATSKAGDNVLCLYIAQLPQGSSASSAQPTVSRNCFTANYTVNNGTVTKIPSDGLVPVTSGQFAPTICNSAACK